MKPLSSDRIHSHAGRSDLLQRTLAGILILLATIPGTLMLGGEGEDDARNEVESRVNGTKSSNEDDGRLWFERHGGLNVVLSKDGITARKKTFLPYYAMTFTNRHLKANELFEIKLELNDRFNGDETTQFMSFGVTNNTKAELTKRLDDALAGWNGRKNPAGAEFYRGDVHDNVNPRVFETISSNEEVGRLSFQQDGGLNVAFSNNGITANKKMEFPAYSVALTSRHLKNDELFEINVERKPDVANETVLHLTIGVTNLTYADIVMSGTVIQPRDGMMRWHIPNDDQDSSPDAQNFIKNGMRLGVMRMENGSLNIFVNGADEGQVLRYVPGPVYGAVELMSMGIQASIIDTSSTA